MSHINPLKELEHELEQEVREHTHRAAEETKLAEEAFEKLEEVRKEEEEERGHHRVKFVIDGVPVEVMYKEEETLAELIPRALAEAGHAYKPEDRWQVKLEGKVLDINKTMCELKLPECATLFLTLEAGTLG